MIRKATQCDIDEVVCWGRKFYESSPWANRVDMVDEHFVETINHLFETDTGAVFLNGHGLCGGVINPLYFNFNCIAGIELFWFAEKGGAALRDAFESWVKSKGATHFQLCGMAGQREMGIRRMYRMAGFEEAEISFLKEI